MNDIMGKTKETDIDDLFSTGTGPIISMDNLLSIGNNTVAPVQPDYSYAKSLLSDFDSDLNSNMFGNGGKIPKTYQGDLSYLKDVGYQKWRANLPTNLREETSDYNLYEAYKSGAKPRLESDGYYHLPSRDPRTNKILKKPTHPTYGMALREDAVEGYLPIYKNGETYTYPLPWIKADGGKLNMFAKGGNIDNNRTAMPAHPATNPYKRRSWETDEEYKERIQDLDNKSQEAALNDSTAINKYKEWEANIQKQQKINEEKSKAITIEKNTKRAKTLEKEFNSLRNIPSQMSSNDTIQAINKNIPEAYKQQYINNINMYKPALDTIDLGINLYSLYNPTVPVLSVGLLTNGLQFRQSIVDGDLRATDYSALAFDTLGLLGATNKLPTRLRIGKNRFWDIDKTADYLGAGQNILDSASDVYDLSKTGYHLYNNKGSNNLYISPFKKSFDEGGNLSYIDADNRRSNILLHTEDGNLYDSAGNNYTQSYLDEENIPIIKGTMPRNTRQYYDPNTTIDFINAVTAPISNFSPSNIVGSIREARDYNTFMNSFMNQDNTGFFTREYAKEHPYISTLGNLGGDILAGVAFDKGIDLYRLGKQAFKEELPYLSTIAKSRLYSDNPIINTYATYARRFNLPDKARLPYLIRRWKPEEIQPIINNELQINGDRLGHTNFTWDRAVISHNKGKWDKGAQTLLINPRELIARNKSNWGSIEPMDMFTITDNGNGFRVPTKDVTIISGNLNTLADAASNNIRTATSKLLQQDEKRIAEDVGESLGRFNLDRDPRKGFDSNMYNHANEIIKRFGFPKIKDVKLLEKLTGLKSYTVPFDKQKKAFIEKLKNFKNLSLNEAEELLENNSNFPNGTPINITSAKSIDKRNLTKFDFNNLFYDPATMAEYLFFNPK